MSSEEQKAEAIVAKMMDNDHFSIWLGIEVEKVSTGYSRLSLTIKKDMLNGFGIAHGGITYSISDSALAFAANSHGRQSVSVETSISHTKPCKEGDKITAIAEEVSRSNKIAIYNITVTNQKGDTVALFKGTVYRSDKEWEV